MQSHYVLSMINNEHANRQLKLKQLFAGIDQTLGMHIGRHTFCSQMAEVWPAPYLIKQLAGYSYLHDIHPPIKGAPGKETE